LSAAPAARRRVLVVDDERPARAKVARLIAGDTRFQVVGEAADGFEALDRIAALLPDLLILDIGLPGIDGFEVLEAVGPDRGFALVFSTAHDEHALRAFDAHAVDYLLKPYDGHRFERALDKAFLQTAGARGPVDELLAARPAKRRLAVKALDHGWVALGLDELLRVSAANKHVCVFASGGRYLVREPLRVLARQLDPRRFVRVHRSEVVNVDAVVRLETSTHGDGLVILADGSSVPLSRTYRKDVLEKVRARSEAAKL
jgi:two-component system LytT family response regulator